MSFSRWWSLFSIEISIWIVRELPFVQKYRQMTMLSLMQWICIITLGKISKCCEDQFVPCLSSHVMGLIINFYPLFCSGSMRVVTANNDALVRVFDVEKFGCLGCFSFDWSVNVSGVPCFRFILKKRYWVFGVPWHVFFSCWFPSEHLC